MKREQSEWNGKSHVQMGSGPKAHNPAHGWTREQVGRERERERERERDRERERERED